MAVERLPPSRIDGQSAIFRDAPVWLRCGLALLNFHGSEGLCRLADSAHDRFALFLNEKRWPAGDRFALFLDEKRWPAGDRFGPFPDEKRWPAGDRLAPFPDDRRRQALDDSFRPLRDEKPRPPRNGHKRPIVR